MKRERQLIILGIVLFSAAGLLLENAHAQNFADTAAPAANAVIEEPKNASVENAEKAANAVTEEPKNASVENAEKAAKATNAQKTEAAQTPLTQEDVANMLMEEGLPVGEGVEDVASSQYTLGANDVIEITVLRHPEVTGKYPLNNEGKIQYEFVGDIALAGLKKDEARDVIAKSLEKYIISPEISVKIIEYNSKIVYVLGEVGQPGKVFMRGDTITVREALVRAGLPLLSAKAGACKLITPSLKKKPVIKSVDVSKLLYEGDLRENLVMRTGDTLYVPATVMTKIMRVLQPVATPIGTAAGTARTVYTPGL